MKMAVATCPDAPAAAMPRVAARPRVLDYLQLTKPRVSVMVLFTVAAGYLLGAGASPRAAVLFHTLLGTALVAGGASALNMLLERRSDARMRRTANRPLPAGRLRPAEVCAFGMLLGQIGFAYLLLTVPHPAAALVAAFTFLAYVGVYTPLKAVTTWNTVVGAVPGALPPVIGWCAARGTITWEAVTLFLVLFVWQLPHFYAIAWMYRTEYARAGLRMLPVADPDGRRTARQMVLGCLALIAVSLLPVALGAAGWVYAAGAVLLGLVFLAPALRFRRARTEQQARKVLKASLLYLPGLLALILLTALPGCFRPTPAAPAVTADDGPRFPVGPFALTERSGRTVRDTDLRGKVWVASFVFTRCTGPCPQVTAAMARLQHDLAGEPDVRLVTFTVDPGHDDPAELTRYAEHFHADPERWLFLTGPEAEIHRLMTEGFKVGVARSPEPKPGREFDHSTFLVVVDRAGVARGYFPGVRSPDDPGTDAEFEANLQRLRQKVAALLREPG